ncbi:MAG TPA: hypothetical protein VLA00_06905 [Xanthobacteraceae bacterium]|nr:hypothetical protein [Xanthobacteraceae bacterium]
MPRSAARLIAALGLLAAIMGSARAFEAPAWSGSYVGRLQVLALMQSLNAELLSRDSATATLELWCAAHRLAAPARIVADRVGGAEEPASDEIRALLQVSAQEPVVYRRVRLRCGAHVLSEADNWYVPSLLTPEMNRQLTETDAPFGRVVRPLDFRRRTLAARLMWSPLPEGWEMAAAPPASAPLALPPFLIEHRAVLTLPDGRAFSALVESYTSAALAFPAPAVP